MALNECEGCTTLFAVGLRMCPNCRSKDFHEEGEMPKITVHGGPSNAALDAENARLAAENDAPAAAISPAAPEVEPLVGSVPDQGPVFAPLDDAPADDAPAVVTEESDDSSEEMTLSELRKECEKQGLPTYGNKAALKMRLNGPAE
jgi:RNA polymerase subunit RPABC4/transcription elongation factor Spt4